MKLQELLKPRVQHGHILVFRSDLDDYTKAAHVCNKLLQTEGVFDAHVDLWDWEHILRIDCVPDIAAEKIEQYVSALGYSCSELED